MSDLVGNPEDRFSHNEAHIKHVSKDLPNITLKHLCNLHFTAIFVATKSNNFWRKTFNINLTFAKNIDCRYSNGYKQGLL